MQEAEDYFAGRLHSQPWNDADDADKPKALLAARRLIDNLNFKGHKHSVWVFHQQCRRRGATRPTAPSTARPRNSIGSRSVTPRRASRWSSPAARTRWCPRPIRRAEYELAFSLLDGVDPQMELENLSVTAQGYAEVRTHFERNMVPIEHLINLVPNPLAWSLLKPFLRDDQAVRLSRVS